MPLQLSDTLLACHEPHLFTVESAAQFAKTLKQCDECYCFLFNLTYHVAHGGNKVAEVNQHSEKMLDELEKEYQDMFSEPRYPISEYRQPFWIPLIDTSN